MDAESTASSSFATSSFNTSSSLDLSQVNNIEISSTQRTWGWAITNKWAERTVLPKGPAIRCLFPGCKTRYLTKKMTTTGINNHLDTKHHITRESPPNDGSLSRGGPLDALFHSAKQPRIFDPTNFNRLLVGFIVRTKQPFTIVKSPEFQALLNHATMATEAQVRLPSDDTMAAKVGMMLSLNCVLSNSCCCNCL